MSEYLNGRDSKREQKPENSRQLTIINEAVERWRRSVSTQEGEQNFFKQEFPQLILYNLYTAGKLDSFINKRGLSRDSASLSKIFGDLPSEREENTRFLIASLTGQELPEPIPDLLSDGEFKLRSENFKKAKGAKLLNEAYSKLVDDITVNIEDVVEIIGEDNFYSSSRSVMSRWKDYLINQEGSQIQKEDSRGYDILKKSGLKQRLDIDPWREMEDKKAKLKFEVYNRTLDIVNRTDPKDQNLRLPENFDTTGGILRINGYDFKLPVKEKSSYIMDFGDIVALTMLLDTIKIDPDIKNSILSKILPTIKQDDNKLAVLRPSGEQMFTFDPAQTGKIDASKLHEARLYDADFLTTLIALRRDNSIDNILKRQYDELTH